MTDNNKIIEAIGKGGKSALKIALITSIPIPQVNKAISLLHRDGVLSLKGEAKYWISQAHTKNKS